MRASWLLVPLVLSACKTDPSPLTPASGSSAAAPSGDAVAGGGTAVGGSGAGVAPSASASVGEASSATPPGMPPPGGDLHPPPSFDAPVKMAIRASGDGKELDFSLDVNVIDTSDIPTTLVIVLPAGATLTKGKASETVSMASAGKKTFDYHLSSPVALTEQTPVRAVLDGRDPQGRSGFHAERRWPERKEGGPPPKSSHTPPPGGRPPMPPRKAP